VPDIEDRTVGRAISLWSAWAGTHLAHTGVGVPTHPNTPIPTRQTQSMSYGHCALVPILITRKGTISLADF
jgi:hypothetical protein